MKSYRHSAQKAQRTCASNIHGRLTFLTLNIHIRLSRSPAFVSELKISEKWRCILLHSPILLQGFIFMKIFVLRSRRCIFYSFTQSNAYRPFKVIQAWWFWHQSKASMGLPISLSYYIVCHTTLVLSYAVSDRLPLTGWKLQIFLSYPHVSHFDSKFPVKFTTKKLESWGYFPVKTA